MARVKWISDEIDARTAEVLDLLLKPTNEFVPRLQSTLMQFALVVERKLREQHAFENADTQPRNAIVPPPPRPPQKTMELHLMDIDFVGPLRKR